MNKIAEQKALEEYQIDIVPDDDTMGFTSSDRNETIRLGYIKGYDQAMQDFLEKACEWLSKNARNYYSAYATSDKLIEDFKNHIQNEM